MILENSPERERPETVHNMIALACTFQEKGKYSDAEKWFKQAIAVSEKAYGPNHWQTARTLCSLGVMHYQRGQYAQAEPLFMRSLKILEKARGRNHHEVAENCFLLARFYHSQHREPQAESFYTRAIAIWEKMPSLEEKGACEYEYAYCLNNLAEIS